MDSFDEARLGVLISRHSSQFPFLAAFLNDCRTLVRLGGRGSFPKINAIAERMNHIIFFQDPPEIGDLLIFAEVLVMTGQDLNYCCDVHQEYLDAHQQLVENLLAAL